MSHRRSRRVPPPALVLALALLAAALPASAEVQNVTFEAHPAAPTWQDEVSITVRGEANCLVDNATGERDFVVGVGPVLRIAVQEGCILDPPSFQPFEVTVPFGQLEPADYTIHLTHEGEEEPVLAEGALTVYDVVDLEIALPAVPTDAGAFFITVTGFTDACEGPQPAQVDGNVITLLFPDGCPFLPPGPSLQTFDYRVGPLPAGDYEIRVFRGPVNPGPPQLAKATVHVFDAEGCLPENDVLCLNQDRFAVRVQWKDFEGNEGVGQAIPLLDDTGLFWFFHPENVELTVKVIDACEPFGFFWVFIASGSTVEYEIRVTDTGSDPEETNFYRNQLGQLPSLIADTGAFFCP